MARMVVDPKSTRKTTCATFDFFLNMLIGSKVYLRSSPCIFLTVNSRNLYIRHAIRIPKLVLAQALPIFTYIIFVHLRNYQVHVNECPVRDILFLKVLQNIMVMKTYII